MGVSELKASICEDWKCPDQIGGATLIKPFDVLRTKLRRKIDRKNNSPYSFYYNLLLKEIVTKHRKP